MSSLPAATSLSPASARAGRFWLSLPCVMPGQPPDVAAATAVAAAAAQLLQFFLSLLADLLYHCDVRWLSRGATRRSALAYDTRTLKRLHKVSDCWNFNGKFLVKDNSTKNQIY